MKLRAKVSDPDNPPTRRESDWVGAEVVRPREQLAPVPGGKTFQVFRASKDPDAFLVTDHRDTGRLPACPRGSWQIFKTLQETGTPRVGFSEEEAKRAIARDGYYLFRLQLVMREHAHR